MSPGDWLLVALCIAISMAVCAPSFKRISNSKDGGDGPMLERGQWVTYACGVAAMFMLGRCVGGG